MDGQEQELVEVIQDVWSAVLGVDAESCLQAGVPTDMEQMCARVAITGDWEGTLMLACPESISRLAASIMFAVEPEEATPQDLSDAMGELINVIAGNARGLYGESTSISLPDVYEGDAFDPDGERVISDVSFLCEQTAFRLYALQTI